MLEKHSWEMCPAPYRKYPTCGPAWTPRKDQIIGTLKIECTVLGKLGKS